MTRSNADALLAGNRLTLAGYEARHFGWSVAGKVATITLNRPERKNPLTFESYAELRDLFRQLAYATDVKAVVIHGAGENSVLWLCQPGSDAITGQSISISGGEVM